MAENSLIGWTDHTFNPWIGCQKIGPGCDHCYAEAIDKRFGHGHWGPHAERRRTVRSTWQAPRRWNRLASETGERPWVFCASMADVFDNAVPDEWRGDLWALIRETPNLNWQILTKRVGNVAAMLPPGWLQGFEHVGLMVTVVNQAEADRDIGRLLAIPAAWHGISCEPLLGPIELNSLDTVAGATLAWVIIGGESGPGARPFSVGSARRLIQQCRIREIPVFVKQMGSRPSAMGQIPSGHGLATSPSGPAPRAPKSG